MMIWQVVRLTFPKKYYCAKTDSNKPPQAISTAMRFYCNRNRSSLEQNHDDGPPPKPSPKTSLKMIWDQAVSGKINVETMKKAFLQMFQSYLFPRQNIHTPTIADGFVREKDTAEIWNKDGWHETTNRQIILHHDDEVFFTFSRYQQLVDRRRSETRNPRQAAPSPRKVIDPTFTSDRYVQAELKLTDIDTTQKNHVFQQNDEDTVIRLRTEFMETHRFLNRFVFLTNIWLLPDEVKKIFKNLHELMEEVPSNGMCLDAFNELYRERFGTHIPQTVDKIQVLTEADNAGVLRWDKVSNRVVHSDFDIKLQENFMELMNDVPDSGVHVSFFNHLYREKFGIFIPRRQDESLSEVVKRAADAGVCQIKWRYKKEMLVHRREKGEFGSKMTPDASQQPRSDSAKTCKGASLHENLRDLMKDVPSNGVRLSRFNELYKAKFGIFIPRLHDASVSEVVKRAADAGVCQIKLRNTEIWVHRRKRGECGSKMTPDASQQPRSDSAKTFEGASLHENLRELMKDIPGMGVDIGHFNQLYKERFGMFIPRQAPAFLSDIIKEAEKAGVLALETRNGRSSWVVPLSKSNSSSKETFFGEKQDPGVSSDASWGGKMQDTGGNKMSRGIRKTMVLGDLLKPLSPEENI
jgi:hypothetical protein